MKKSVVDKRHYINRARDLFFISGYYNQLCSEKRRLNHNNTRFNLLSETIFSKDLLFFFLAFEHKKKTVFEKKLESLHVRLFFWRMTSGADLTFRRVFVYESRKRLRKLGGTLN